MLDQLTKESRSEACLYFLYWSNFVNVKASPLLDGAAHHAERHPHQGPRYWDLLLLHQLQHQLGQLGEGTVDYLWPGPVILLAL